MPDNLTPRARPLAGIRVAEFGTGPALAYCGKLFADFGADVTKVEPPGGDPARRLPPLIDCGTTRPESGVFAWLNTNKRSIIADDPARLHDIAGASDVLIDARPPAERGTTGHDALRATFPALTILSLTWFGETGPYKDFAATDSTVRALAGLLKQTGPIEAPGFQPDHQAAVPAALSAFSAAIGTLLAAEHRGRRFEISIHEASVVIAEYQAATAVQMGLPPARRGVNRWFPTFPMGIYPCRDGWLGITVLTADQWRNFCDLLGMADEAADPGYATSALRIARADELEARFAPLLKSRTAREWFAEGLRRRIPFVIVPSTADLLAEPVHRGRGAFGTVRIGNAAFEAPVLPQHLTATPPSADAIAPLAGADTAAWRPAPAVLPRAGAKKLPLDGVRIVDLAMGWAGPLTTRQLADLGAEILKIEGRAYPDWWRSGDYSPEAIARHAHETQLWFNFQNRNKTGLTLDLTRPEGAAILRRLVRTADAVVENYSQGVLPKLGLAYPDLVKERPDLVMVSMPAFGTATEWADVRAYGSTLEQGSGLPRVTGREEWPPTMSHIAYGDPIGGLNACAATLVALLHRKRTGQGQHVDLSQVECMFPLVAPWIIEQSITGRTAPRRGNRHPVHVPHGCFRCAGDDAWIVIAITDAAAWQNLCATIARPDLATADRRAAEDAIEAAITGWTRTRTPDEAMHILQGSGIAAGVARGFSEILQSEPHLQARGFWQEIDRAHIGRHLQPSPTFRENGVPYPIRSPAPTLGQSTREVLTRILGMTEAELDHLESEKIIGTDPIPLTERKPRSAALLREAAR